MSVWVRRTGDHEIFSDYDPFAWFYNLYWGPDFSRIALDALNQILLPQLSPTASILDLCCGTGQLAAELNDKGYRVTGIDGSDAMLRFAKENAPGVSFFRADARSFEVSEPFDACVSMFDSLNHILSLTELNAVFSHVHSALNPNGTFVFDLNTEEEFQIGLRESAFDIVEEDHACIVKSKYDPRENLKRYEVAMFRLSDDVWTRSDMTLFQRYYSLDDIRAALTLASFSDIQILDGSVDLGHPVRDGRAFVRAIRR